MNKHSVYIVIGVCLLLISAVILGVYYTQDFNESYSFVNNIDFASIEVTSYPNGNVNYLQTAKANLGQLNLDNNGVFTRVYYLPTIVGCIDLREGIDKNSVLLRNNAFGVEYIYDGASVYPGRSIEIEVDEIKNLTIRGVYSPNLPMYQFTKENIKSISLYVLPDRQENPIEYDLYNGERIYRGNYYGFDCNSLKVDEKADAVILIS